MTSLHPAQHLTFSRRSAAALAAAVLFLAGCGEEAKTTAADAAAASKTTPAQQAPIPVGVVQLVEHEALDATVKGFIDELAARGFKDGENIRIDHQNAQGDQTTLANIGTRFVSNKSQLIFASSTPAVQAMARATKTIPVVATAVTSFEAAKVVKSDAAPGGNVTGVSNLSPIAAQLDLLVEIAALTPNTAKTKPIGVVFNPSEVNAQFQVDRFKAAAEKLGIEVLTASASSVNDVPQALNSLKGKICGFWFPTDNVIASAAATVAKVAAEAKLPVVASDSALVRAGSLASISVDYYELGRMTGAMGADILEGKKKPGEIPVGFQTAQKPFINLKVAQSIGLELPQALLERSNVQK